MTAGRGPEDAAAPTGPEGRRGSDPEAHVLVVEDDAPMRHLIARLLRENGFRATGARDGREMWEALRRPVPTRSASAPLAVTITTGR